MKVQRIGDPPPESDTRPIFRGRVETQSLVGEDARVLRIASITFRDGARTVLHHHDYEQVLVVTDGRGILATEHEEHYVQLGHVVFVPTGERHWHGAEPGQHMTHLSINTVGETVLDES
jgi:quercetin dioxygenase-like cupin family protein